MIAALKFTSKNSPLSPYEICDIHHDWSQANNLRVLLTTNTRFKPKNRPQIKQVLLYVDVDNAYLVDVVAVGPGYPDSLIRIPEGFSTPSQWEGEERNSWIALEGEFELVDPADYRVDSEPKKALTEVFTTGRASHAYVHSV
ncbi:hypothetical protein [Glutamicibacter ardleyensis]|uniref:hypothetical protein n=1 Tax=Glutamicibacter ardleyensis TaxID=225894 RepID=UPI003FD04079